ncbi:MAG: response regulator transcription factor [Alphaproteobacteria bacterium]|nr:response regulator transcription factor [Alphaproteobacteria bacterium]MBU6473904.1 response regulator transcription factor [Alphaproteobacteria bacterium]MDE2013010.1 response regulator transcription factor [Alphaproteobacteria bacterium]MDE2072403.1 response regulator transcription factor [Alphaproteobacteria bacterium]MDE2352314.1 response regulator transcription factor [Alphaproteobacteria bacterium]
MPRSLLFVELGAKPARELRRGFAAEGFKIDTATGAHHAKNMVAMRRYDAEVLFGDGFVMLQRCLERHGRDIANAGVPLIAVASLTEDEEVRLLDAGASLCVSPEVSFAEALSRLRALIEIAEGFPRHYRIRDLGIDPVARRASRGGVALNLRPREFDLLVYLAERTGETVSGAELHSAFWSSQPFSRTRVAVQVHNLRRAIGKTRQAPLLHTVRPDGYVLCATPPARLRRAS